MHWIADREVCVRADFIVPAVTATSLFFSPLKKFLFTKCRALPISKPLGVVKDLEWTRVSAKRNYGNTAHCFLQHLDKSPDSTFPPIWHRTF